MKREAEDEVVLMDVLGGRCFFLSEPMTSDEDGAAAEGSHRGPRQEYDLVSVEIILKDEQRL